MNQTTRRQHYVWRFHLAAWAIDGKVAVLRKDGRTFISNPANVAVERDFYKLPRLTETEIAFIEQLIDHSLEGETRKESARGWLETPVSMARLRSLLERTGRLTPDADRELERFEIEADEKLMGVIEDNGLPYIQRLRNGDAAFWPDDEDAAIAVSHFISVQHLRTKRIAEVIGDGQLPSGSPVDFQNIWPVMRNVLAASMGFSLFADRRRWRLRTVRATGGRRFITSDQPVMNLLKPVGHNDLALYYPLGPTVAALMEHLDNPGIFGEQRDLDDEAVRMLNRRIFGFSHEQVIGVHPDDFAGLEEAA